MDIAHAGFAFQDLTGIARSIKVVDAGTNPIDDAPPYAGLLRAGLAELVAFAPNPMTLARLRACASPHETYLPHRLADGQEHILHFCESSEMTSLLEPDLGVFGLFHHAPDQARVTGATRVATIRLDDIPEAHGAELLKLSLQGAELLALRHASRLLKSGLVVHTTASFIPLYRSQPLFCDLAGFLRDQGFHLHRFRLCADRRGALPTGAGSSQVVAAEAIFLRDLTRLERLTTVQLVTMAALVHDCYGSTDIAQLLLTHHDERCGEQLGRYYVAGLRGMQSLAASGSQDFAASPFCRF